MSLTLITWRPENEERVLDKGRHSAGTLAGMLEKLFDNEMPLRLTKEDIPTLKNAAAVLRVLLQDSAPFLNLIDIIETNGIIILEAE